MRQVSADTSAEQRPHLNDEGAQASPRVLHAPLEIAGQAALSAYGLREIGVDSSSLSRRHPYSYPVEPDIVPAEGGLGWWRAVIPAVLRHDILHFYYGVSFISEKARGLDAKLLRRSGRRVVVEFVGSDVRMPSLESKRNPYYVAIEGEGDAIALDRMKTWSAITGGHVILSDPALKAFVGPHFPNIHMVPLRVDTRRYIPALPDPATDRPVIVHAPSSVEGKGTRYVRAAVEHLQALGIGFEYVELKGRSNEEVGQEVRRADIVIDQLCSGSYGVFAVEAMSMAKPVICYLHPESAQGYPADLPIINATPETLTRVLEGWLGRPSERRELGLRSREYAERVHDVRCVARRLLDAYASLAR